MSREIKERTILDTFAEDFVNVVEKHAKHLRIIYSDVLDENEITRIKSEIRRLRLS